VGVNPRVKNTGSGKNITPTVNMKSGDQTTIKKRRREQALKPHQKDRRSANQHSNEQSNSNKCVKIMKSIEAIQNRTGISEIE